MQVKILGCSGGIGSAELQTTSFLVGSHTIIDAGTGVVSLTLEQLANINSVFLTHSHMDHIAACPMLIDSSSDTRTKPLTIYALEETITALRKHIFNWSIWPDFSGIVVNDVKSLEFKTINIGDEFELQDGGSILVGPANHQVPGCSYLLKGKREKLFFSGDTCYDKEIINFINYHGLVNHIIFECAFSKNEKKIADLSKHMHTDSVKQLISELDKKSKFYLTHLKPSQRDLIMNEIVDDELLMSEYHISRLFAFQIFTL